MPLTSLLMRYSVMSPTSGVMTFEWYMVVMLFGWFWLVLAMPKEIGVTKNRSLAPPAGFHDVRLCTSRCGSVLELYWISTTISPPAVRHGTKFTGAKEVSQAACSLFHWGPLPWATYSFAFRGLRLLLLCTQDGCHHAPAHAGTARR